MDDYIRLTETDRATAELILRLQLEDLTGPEVQWSLSGEEGSSSTNQAGQVCGVCSEEKSLVVRVQCGHEYCPPCLVDLVRTVLKDTDLFPPRCCGKHIAVSDLLGLFNGELVDEFNLKKIEYGTLDKTYCCRRTCSSLLEVKGKHEDTVTCQKCGQMTCLHCKLSGHEGECPEDEVVQGLLRMADEQKWRRCFSCKSIVKRKDGYSHMR